MQSLKKIHAWAQMQDLLYKLTYHMVLVLVCPFAAETQINIVFNNVTISAYGGILKMLYRLYYIDNLVKVTYSSQNKDRFLLLKTLTLEHTLAKLISCETYTPLEGE